MNLRARLAALESQLAGPDDIVLEFADGSHATIALNRRKSLLDVFRGVIENPDSAEADLIRRSVSSNENGSHMIELCKAAFLADLPEELVNDTNEGSEV
jgi:hypothetical protein